MKHSIFFTVDATILCLALFAGCILMVIFGRGIRKKFLANDEVESKGGVISLLGALFGLWGFVLAFTFSNVSSRFEIIRTTLVEEANTIRNVILRSEAFPDSIRIGFREDLKKYLQTRIDYYDQTEDLEKFNKAKTDALEIGKKLWTRTINVTNRPNLFLAGNNMLASLTAMYDIAARRDAMLMAGIPAPISFMLFFIAIIISFVGGFTSPVIKTKEWVIIIGFIFLACFLIYIILDLARPMRGLIKPDIGQEKIIQLQKLF